MTSTRPAPPAVPTTPDPERLDALAAALVHYLETEEAAPGLFAPDVFCDLVLPTWRVQAQGVDATRGLRRAGHPWPGRVAWHRLDHTARGFVLEVREEWVDLAATSWSCLELLRADVGPDGITDLSVYCTGDWDEARTAAHAEAVELIRP